MFELRIINVFAKYIAIVSIKWEVLKIQPSAIEIIRIGKKPHKKATFFAHEDANINHAQTGDNHRLAAIKVKNELNNTPNRFEDIQIEAPKLPPNQAATVANNNINN